MQRAVWKGIYVTAALLLVVGVAIIVWGLSAGVGATAGVSGGLLAVIAALLARMAMLAHGRGERPGPGAIFPILALLIVALAWNAFIGGVL